jgi:hypothetical protein
MSRLTSGEQETRSGVIRGKGFHGPSVFSSFR